MSSPDLDPNSTRMQEKELIVPPDSLGERAVGAADIRISRQPETKNERGSVPITSGCLVKVQYHGKEQPLWVYIQKGEHNLGELPEDVQRLLIDNTFTSIHEDTALARAITGSAEGDEVRMVTESNKTKKRTEKVIDILEVKDLSA